MSIDSVGGKQFSHVLHTLLDEMTKSFRTLYAQKLTRNGPRNTVEPPNMGQFGIKNFVPCREVVPDIKIKRVHNFKSISMGLRNIVSLVEGYVSISEGPQVSEAVLHLPC